MKNISLKEIRNKRRRNRSKRNNLFHFERPRLVIYRTSKHISAQIIDDHKSSTLVSASSNEKSLQKDLSKAQSKMKLIIKENTTIQLYCSISLKTNDAAGNPHIICTGIDLNNAI